MWVYKNNKVYKNNMFMNITAKRVRKKSIIEGVAVVKAEMKRFGKKREILNLVLQKGCNTFEVFRICNVPKINVENGLKFSKMADDRTAKTLTTTKSSNTDTNNNTNNNYNNKDNDNKDNNKYNNNKDNNYNNKYNKDNDNNNNKYNNNKDNDNKDNNNNNYNYNNYNNNNNNKDNNKNNN